MEPSVQPQPNPGPQAQAANEAARRDEAYYLRVIEITPPEEAPTVS